MLRRHLPDSDGAILTGRGKLFAVGRPCHSPDYVGMALKENERLAGGSIPDVYGFIIAAGCQPFAIRRPCQRIGFTGSRIAAVSQHRLTGCSIPDLYRIAG